METRQNHILVTGASGNIGSKVAEALLDLDCNVIVNGRAKEKLNPFQDRAKVVAGDLEDEDVLHELLQNAQAVFLVMPVLKGKSVQDFVELFLKTATDYKISHIVNISNCTLERWGKPTSLIEFEQHLSKAKNLHIKHLRCANFFENLNWGIHTPYHADIKLPYISSFEVAHVASQYLAKRNFEGISVDELMGRKDYSMKDFAEELGVKYRQVEAPEAYKSFFEAFNSGNYKVVERTKENTSKSVNDKFSLDYFLTHCFHKSALE